MEPTLGEECHRTAKNKNKKLGENNSTLGSKEGQGWCNNVPGKECFYGAPEGCPDDFFGLQLTAPSPSISRDFKNKDRLLGG